MPGMSPRLFSGRPKRAERAAMRRSQASASSSPPPTHVPLIAAMSGFSRASRSLKKLVSSRVLARNTGVFQSVSNVDTSAPTQNVLPVPVNTTTRTVSFAYSSSARARKSPRISIEIALFFSGRLMVTTAIPSVSSYFNVAKAMRFPPEAGPTRVIRRFWPGRV